MNPELERLLVALAARDNASPAQFDEADAEVERLLQPILERLSPIGRAEFLRALQSRYRAYLKGEPAAANIAAVSISPLCFTA